MSEAGVLSVTEPNLEVIAERYRALEADLARPASDAPRRVLRDWDAVRRELKTYDALTRLRFDQNTKDPQARAGRQRLDELTPKFIELDDAMKRRFAEGRARAAVEPVLGSQAFRLWECDLATFVPAIEDDLVVEARLGAEYLAVIAGISVEFRGERLNLAGLAKYGNHPAREVRHAAAAARWAALGERRAEIDRIYGELVRVRDRMARALGYRNYTDVGYRKQRRIGYGRAEVERWRDAVVEHVVPVVARLVERAKSLLGVERVMVWDEPFVTGVESFPQLGGADWLMEHAVAGLSAMDPQLGTFATLMRDRGLTDLPTREGKRAGAYCAFVPSLDMPFVFHNANGSRDDVKTLMHELGHAFQGYRSRSMPVLDYVMATHETAEIHSMSLEFLSWPEMERFFGREADAYRRAHLAAALMFLPYGCAVDHFQHLVYDRPEATPQERHAMWQSVERRYLPWRAYGDLQAPSDGGFWHSQLHIFSYPFYYIDYTLAQCCALQLWAASQTDRASTLERYVALCDLGGSRSFGELVRATGLASPFEPSVLGDVVASGAPQSGRLDALRREYRSHDLAVKAEPDDDERGGNE